MLATEGLNLAAVVAVASTVVVWAILAHRLERWNVSGPMFFVVAGLFLANEPVQLVALDIQGEGIRELAEVTLAVVLFGDAAGVRISALRKDAALPTRLLGIGLPLTMAAGALAAKALFPDLSWALCALIGAAVAPTDAALGAAIIEDERVPARLRRVLNVESGLNDGIATPFVSFFLAAALSGATTDGSVREALADLGLGVLVGAAIGFVGGWLLARSGAATSSASRNLGAVALGLVAYGAVVEMGANGFVAAFVAGLAYGRAERRREHDEFAQSLRLTRQGAELLSFIVWFLFGAAMVPELVDVTWQMVLYALVALTLLRMVPVGLSLLGLGFDRPTVALIGWFGPRGLASVVFALLAVGELPAVDGEPVLITITMTVAASVVLHGLTAAPFARRYAASHPAAPEAPTPPPAPASPTRG